MIVKDDEGFRWAAKGDSLTIRHARSALACQTDYLRHAKESASREMRQVDTIGDEDSRRTRAKETSIHMLTKDPASPARSSGA
jgi:hypothetical protein